MGGHIAGDPYPFPEKYNPWPSSFSTMIPPDYKSVVEYLFNRAYYYGINYFSKALMVELLKNKKDNFIIDEIVAEIEKLSSEF